MPNLQVIKDASKGRYRLLADGEEVGYGEYDPVGTTSILIKHTEVSPQHEGKGYGSRLVEGMLADVRAQGKTVIPICPYTLNYIRRHREHADLVRADLRSTL
jgi:uncharacterized protein